MGNFLERLMGSPVGRLFKNPLMQRVIKNSGYLFTGSTLSAGLSMVQGILAARLLSLDEYGLLGLITVFASVINRLTSFRMSELVVSYVGEHVSKGEKQQAAAMFKATSLVEIFSSLLAFGLILLLSPIGARVIAKDQTTTNLFIFYGFIILANLIAESATGLLQVFDRFRELAAISVFQSAFTLVLIGAAYFQGGGLIAVLTAYLLGKVVWALAITASALAQAAQAWGGGWWRAPVSLLSGRWREYVRFAFSTNISGTLTLISRDSELLWLGAFSTPAQVAYYKVAQAVTRFLIIPIEPLISTTYRELAREAANDRWENIRYLLRSGSMISALFTLPAALFLVLFGRWVISLYGVKFLPTAYHSLIIMLAGIIAVNLFYWNRKALLSFGHPDYPTKVQFVAAVLKILGIVLLVPRFGAVGMSSLLSLFFIGVVFFTVLKTVRLVRAGLSTTAAS